ncbi:type-F conjugative transfer system protein TraW [Loktanella sp. IMCC34160]|uniref:type-F conjugative transfer system protein TraW n=1 Tax=Loktanella sp. IMCC34160 TaxID=2510646 RepID=UPI00101C7937|nr:type-F conjugative transfer system protein TraW [Loktanella sp. IMCC34160]RYG89914.1 type-F conjugative transfer system protein TraW [Loktanella sp. IMCC34160]
MVRWHRRVTTTLAVTLATVAGAEDFGTHGPVWEIAEPSLLDTIRARLTEMEASGELAGMQQEMQDRTRAYVMRPRPVMGLLPVEEERIFKVDLSITLTRDLMDHEGRVFARAGTVINPLDYSFFNKRIVFLDGDDPDQVAFALEEGTELDTLLVLTNGAPLDLMRAHGRRFYFDQDGIMVDRFGVLRLPSEVWREGNVMMVREVPTGGQSDG